MPIELPRLPWAADALEPAISRRTIETHHGKHHKGYVEKANKLAAEAGLEALSLEEVMLETVGDKPAPIRALFNSSAQVWNHNRYWNSLSPKSSAPSDALAAQVQIDFGDIAALKDELVKKGVAHFASGWVWLVHADNKLKVIDTHDADNTLVQGADALLVLDLWEHAYYLDYQQERERHLRAVVEDALNWQEASARFEQAR